MGDVVRYDKIMFHAGVIAGLGFAEWLCREALSAVTAYLKDPEKSKVEDIFEVVLEFIDQARHDNILHLENKSMPLKRAIEDEIAKAVSALAEKGEEPALKELLNQKEN